MTYFLLLAWVTIGFQLSFFTDPIFSTLEGWVMHSFNQVGSKIGVYDSKSYAGLDFLVNGNLFIILYNLPPHQYLRIRAKMIIKSSVISYVKVSWFVDHHRVWNFQNAVKQLQIHEQQLDAIFTHNANSIFLRYVDQQDNRFERGDTSGIRDVYLDFISCPAGCLKCELGQSQLICQQYKKIDSDLSASQLSNFNNDGWYFQDPTKILSIFQCEQDIKINFFGIFEKLDVITKIFILPPHYYIQIEVLIIFLRQRLIQTLLTLFEIDGKIVDSNSHVLQKGYFSLCNYKQNWHVLDTDDDGLERFKLNLLHTKRTMNLTIHHQQVDETNVLWGLRDFQIFYKACHSSCVSGCNGPYITDCIDSKFSLTSLSEYFFDQRLSTFEGWTSVVSYDSYSLCNHFQLLGGFGLLQGNQQLTQVIYNISSHTTLSLSFTLYQIDEFDLNDKFFIYINEEKVYERTFVQLTPSNGYKICGTKSLDLTFKITITQIPHTASFAVITFYTSQTSINGFWGIKSIKINYNQHFLLSQQLNQQKDQTISNFSMVSTTPIKTFCSNGNYDFIGYFLEGYRMRKQIFNIPAHQQLVISWKIIIAHKSLSTSAKSVSIMVDGNTIWQQSFKMNSENNACDNPKYSTIYKFEIFVDHKLPEVLIEFFSNFEIDQYWGVRELKISLLDNPSP